MPAQQAVDPSLKRGDVGALAKREREHPNPQLILLRQPPARAHETLKKAPLGGEEQPRSISRVIDASTAVLHTTQSSQCKLDQLPRGTRRVGDRSDSAAAPSGMKLQPIGDPPCLGRVA